MVLARETKFCRLQVLVKARDSQESVTAHQKIHRGQPRYEYRFIHGLAAPLVYIPRLLHPCCLLRDTRKAPTGDDLAVCKGRQTVVQPAWCQLDIRIDKRQILALGKCSPAVSQGAYVDFGDDLESETQVAHDLMRPI